MITNHGVKMAQAAGLQKIRNVLERIVIGDLGSAKVDAVHLFNSDLQPGGSVYTRLFSAPLRKTA